LLRKTSAARATRTHFKPIASAPKPSPQLKTRLPPSPHPIAPLQIEATKALRATSHLAAALAGRGDYLFGLPPAAGVVGVVGATVAPAGAAARCCANSVFSAVSCCCASAFAFSESARRCC